MLRVLLPCLSPKLALNFKIVSFGRCRCPRRQLPNAPSLTSFVEEKNSSENLSANVVSAPLVKALTAPSRSGRDAMFECTAFITRSWLTALRRLRFFRKNGSRFRRLSLRRTCCMNGREMLMLYIAKTHSSVKPRFILRVSYKLHEANEMIMVHNQDSGSLSMRAIASIADIRIGNGLASMNLHIPIHGFLLFSTLL